MSSVREADAKSGRRAPASLKKPVVLVLGPSRTAISGVTTHVNGLLQSDLRAAYQLEHFQVGSEGRRESALERAFRFVSSPLGLAIAITRRHAAIVHLNTSWNAKAYWRDLSYLVVAKWCGAKVVLQKHGGSLRAFWGANPLFAAFVRATLRLADAVVVLSRAERDEYERLLGRDRVVLVPNGIECAPFRAHRRQPPDPGAPLRCVYIGRLAPRKGLDELLDGLAPTRATLVIAGSGPDEERLRLRARELGLAERVRFDGPTYGEDKARLLARSDVLILPSHTEGLPYALLEAMAAGVVPVVTPVGAIPDVVEAGTHGLFVEVGDAAAIAAALETLDADRARLAHMSTACRERIATEYSIERVAADFGRVYDSLVVARAPHAVR